MHQGDQGLTKKNSGGDPTPVEKRVISTVKWVIQKYGIDPDRVYLSGNSMGGNGTLGIGMRHGDVFAAIKANVPAGIEHVSNRMYFPPQTVPEKCLLPMEKHQRHRGQSRDVPLPPFREGSNHKI